MSLTTRSNKPELLCLPILIYVFKPGADSSEAPWGDLSTYSQILHNTLAYITPPPVMNWKGFTTLATGDVVSVPDSAPEVPRLHHRGRLHRQHGGPVGRHRGSTPGRSPGVTLINIVRAFFTLGCSKMKRKMLFLKIGTIYAAIWAYLLIILTEIIPIKT